MGLVDDLAVNDILDSLFFHDLDVVRVDEHLHGPSGFEGVVVLDLEFVAGIGFDIHLVMDALEHAGFHGP